MHVDEACALLLEACDLIERHAGAAVRDDALLHEVTILRERLLDAGGCDDPDVAGDVDGVLAQLQDLQAHLAHPARRGRAHAA
jgi:hypothetical protein